MISLIFLAISIISLCFALYYDVKARKKIKLARDLMKEASDHLGEFNRYMEKLNGEKEAA